MEKNKTNSNYADITVICQEIKLIAVEARQMKRFLNNAPEIKKYLQG